MDINRKNSYKYICISHGKNNITRIGKVYKKWYTQINLEIYGKRSTQINLG